MWDLLTKGIREDLDNLRASADDLIDQVIVNSPAAWNNSVFDGYYLAAQNLAVYFAYIVFVILLSVFGLVLKKGKGLLQTLVAIFVISAVSPIWLSVVGNMWAFGTALAQAMAFYDSSPAGALFPTIGNNLGAIIANGYTLLFGGALVAFMFILQPMVVVFAAWMPLTYSVSGLGKRSKQLANLVLSLGLVGTVFGRASAVFFRQLGQLSINTMPAGNTTFGIVLYRGMFDLLAAISIITLVFISYVGATKVEGWISAKTRGTTQSVVRGTVDIRNPGRPPMPRPVNASTGSRPLHQDISRAIRHEAVNRVAKRVVQVAVGAIASPAASKAAGHVAGGAFRRRSK